MLESELETLRLCLRVSNIAIRCKNPACLHARSVLFLNFTMSGGTTDHAQDLTVGDKCVTPTGTTMVVLFTLKFTLV